MEHLRRAGPNERRYIVRQVLDHYRALIVGGIYTYETPYSDAELEDALIKALKHCVRTHPFLSASLTAEETETPAYTRPPTLDLENHIELLDARKFPRELDERGLVKYALIQTHDRPFTNRDKTPPWKIVVLPLPGGQADSKVRFLIMFAYDHSHGDGKSGLAFHKSFLAGLRLSSEPDCPYKADKTCKTLETPLLPPMEQAGKLSISWSYLLSPLLGAYLPSFVAGPLGLRASATPESEDLWRGRETSHDPNDFHTGIEIMNVPFKTLQNILSRCKSHNTKFTGLLNQLIVRALSRNLPAETAGSFVSQTVVDLRRHLPAITDDDMALCASAHYEISARIDAETEVDNDALWTAARATTLGLAERASSLHNQPIGLLAYLREFYPWTRGQIGKQRDSSFEVSNLTVFNPGPSCEDAWNVESMIFSQPANATSSPLSFNVVSKQGGDLTLVISWQRGVLGVVDELDFVKRVAEALGSLLGTIGQV